MLRQGAAVAREALTVRGDVSLAGDVLVVVPRTGHRVRGRAQPSALVGELQRRRPGWRLVDVADAERAAAEVAGAGARPVLLVVESADSGHDAAVARAVLAAAPEAVVVYGGLSRADHPGPRTVHSHGTGAATAVATADVLLGEVTP